MKPRQRHGTLLLAIALLATAGVLGTFRWSQRTRSADSGQPSAPSVQAVHEAAVFSDLPRHSDRAPTADERLAAKVSQRRPGSRTSDIDQPRPGEPTYGMADLPKTCGTYWVADANGGFSRVAVCNPENHPGGSH